MKKAVLVTGASGGIGSALTRAFKEKDWFVIGTSRAEPSNMSDLDVFIPCDLRALATDDGVREKFATEVHAVLSANGIHLKTLINNAAMQILGGAEEITSRQLADSFAINAIAPFVLTQAFLPELELNGGSVLNIGTVHAQSTKKGFVAYATSKTAMHGLTRSLAVDLGGRIRVNCLAPAATATPMLMAGFEGRKESFEKLAGAHPVGRIAEPEEIAKTALFLSSDDASFITGATLYCDGGVLSRLHDPE